MIIAYFIIVLVAWMSIEAIAVILGIICYEMKWHWLEFKITSLYARIERFTIHGVIDRFLSR